MENEKVGEWTGNDRTQCNFKLSHEFNSQDAFALVKGYGKKPEAFFYKVLTSTIPKEPDH